MADLLDDLDDEQRAAAQAVTGPVCIVAGAGTGKTRTVTYRLAYGILTGHVRPGGALAVTHSRKAAAELGERLNRLGVGGADALTFHAAGLRVVRRFWERTGRPGPGPAVLPEPEAWRMWRDALRRVGAGAPQSGDPDNAALRDVIDEVGWARARRLSPEDYATEADRADRHPGVDPATIVGCWAAYEEAKAGRGRLDFADLLEVAAGLLESDDDAARVMRHRWEHVTVDEYQDTDPAQQRLLDAVVGPGRDLCVVGDPRQAIYSWKGADPGYLTGFPRRHADARVFDLTRNYRSSPEIIDWANRVARQPGTRPLVATRAGGQRPRVTRAESEAGEAAWVAGAARRAVEKGTPVSEIAVLYRFNATQARFEAALARAGLATVVAEDTTFFDRQEVRAVLVPFGRAARATPDQAGLELLGSVLARTGFDRERPPEGLGAARSRWESQRALLELVEASPDMAGADARGLLDRINALAVSTHGPRVEGITLATLHRAKGLEWDVVFLVGMTDGAAPSAFAQTAEELAEEERLIHVGISRARRELHLTWPATNSRGWDNRPSPYLDLLPGGAPVPRPTARGTSSGRGRPGRGSSGPDRKPAATPALRESGPTCPHCSEPLKGAPARRLGVCPDCLVQAPGSLGRRARALAALAEEAATAAGVSERRLLTRSGLARLLDRRPDTAAGVAGVPGVALTGTWAEAAVAILEE